MIDVAGEQFFSRDEINNFLEQRRFELEHQVYELKPDYLLNTEFDELRDWLVERHQLSVPELGEHDVEHPQEEWIDIMRGRGEDWGRSGLHPDMPITQRGTKQDVRIRFAGDPRFSMLRPTSF